MGKVVKRKLSDKQLDKRRETKKLSMRRAREKLKEDPEKHRELKKKDAERKRAKRKKITDMNDREKRKMRKEWRERAKKCRERKRMEPELITVGTPPHIPQKPHTPELVPSSSRVQAGKRKMRKNKKKLKEQMKKLKKENEALKKKASKYRKKYYRLADAIKEDTPKKEVRKLLKGQRVSPKVRRTIEFCSVLSNQVGKNFKLTHSVAKKNMLVRMITGKIIKKYRFLHRVGSLTSQRIVKNTVSVHDKTKRMKQAEKDVARFLERDENSRMCSGKKETITRHKLKKQKRLLCDSLKNLHKKYKASNPERKLSYTTFCRSRPFWIVAPDCTNRDTCLCKLHANVELMVKKINSLRMIAEKSSHEILARITCEEKLEEKCLEKTCSTCKDCNVQWNEFDDEEVTYYQWVTKKVEVVIKGKAKMCQKTVKEEVISTKRKMVSDFEKLLDKFRQHTANIIHQHRITSDIKNSLSADEVLLHIDFSENYNCKYSTEVQSVHFGGSRNQVTLHTVVMYYKSQTDSSVQNRSICTLSASPKHNPVAICAHLMPVFSEVKNCVPNLKAIHFLSDGPTTQYRNKNMFFLAATFLTKELQVNSFHWHYSEAGHGKGAPDGVGGYVKRLADNLVAQGKDIPNIDILMSEIKNSNSNMFIHKIDTDDIEKIEKYLPNNVPSFKGVLKVHEINWCRENGTVVQARRLSCIMCKAGASCTHYGIGQITVDHPSYTSCSKTLKYNEVYTDDSDEAENKQPVAFHVKRNSYIVVKYTSQRNFQTHYVGIVEKVAGQELQVNFMRKSTGFAFVFPDEKNIELIDLAAVKEVLSQPTMNQRNQFFFPENMGKYINLC